MEREHAGRPPAHPGAPSTSRRRPARLLATDRRVAVAKTISWRFLATATTFLIAWMFTGDLSTGAAIGGAEAVTKMFLYYGHERLWSRSLTS